MENKKNRLVTIDYDEYIQLLYYKGLLEENRDNEIRHGTLSYTCVQRTICKDLFDYLALDSSVGKIELFRSDYDDETN